MFQLCLSNYLWFTCVFIVLSVQFDFVWSTRYSPVFLSVSLTLSCPDVIKDCYFEFMSSSACSCSSLVCAPWQKTRPTTVCGAHSPRLVFCFLKSFYFVPVCLSRGMEVAARYSRHSPLQVGVGARRDRRESTGRDALMPADRGRSRHRLASDSMPAGSPLTQCPPARLWLNARRPASDSMPAGSPLTQARRIAADSSPPDRRWLMPAGSALTHARRPPLSLAPWIKSTCHGQECRVSVLLCPQEHFKEPCLVHGDSSGAGGSSCCGHGGHSSRLPPCRGGGSGCWGTLWGPLMSCHAQRKPQLPSQPRRASGSCGMSCPVCLALEGLSCPVMYCSVCPAPEGSWYPLTSPGTFFFGGGRRVPAGVAWPRDEATAMNDHLPWSPELPAPPWPPELPAPPWSPELPAPPWSPELPAPPWSPELPAPPWSPELPAPPWPPLSVPLWRSPSCVPVRVCPEGPPERPPPLPGGTVTAWDTPSERGELCQGSVVCVMCSRLMCPYLVCFLSLFHVIMS